MIKCIRCGDEVDYDVCPSCCDDHEFSDYDDNWAFCTNCGKRAPFDYFNEDPNDYWDEVK